MFKNYIVEGIDQSGKSSLINGLKNKLGFYQVVHYKKPELLDCYFQSNDANKTNKSYAYKTYQMNSFSNMFHMLSGSGKYILDRSFLGEYVYAPRYRGYDGSYVFDLEKQFVDDLGSKFHINTLLILLETDDFNFIKDDGLSLDFDKKEEELQDFKRAFERSIIKHKLMINISDGMGNYVPADIILRGVINAINEFPNIKKPIWHMSWIKNGDRYDQTNNLVHDVNKIVG